MRWDDRALFAVLDAMAKQPRPHARLAFAALAGEPIDAAAMLAQLAASVMRLCVRETLLINPRDAHVHQLQTPLPARVPAPQRTNSASIRSTFPMGIQSGHAPAAITFRAD